MIAEFCVERKRKMKLKVLEFNSEEYWDYIFSLPKEERERMLSKVPDDWNENNPFVYVELELKDKYEK